MMEPFLESRIRGGIDALRAEGELLSKEEVAKYSRTFRAHFGPEVLSSLDGEMLLNTMHEHGTKDSLVYWLEFKNDDEFPAKFGSIAGGSALKFGIFKSKETRAWMTGRPTAQKVNTLPEAIAVARRHRDQLVAGMKILDGLPRDLSAVNYDDLENCLVAAAPDVANLSWGHKYFSLLAYELLDDYHAPGHQTFHLLKLLVDPPVGRYRAARPFAQIARQFDLYPHHLATVLNRVDGEPRRWMRIGTADGGDGRSEWPGMRGGSYVAVGWAELGNLSGLESGRDGREEIKKRVAEHYPNAPSAVGNAASQVFDLVVNTKAGDLIAAMNGARSVLGVGRVLGDYEFAAGTHFPHRRRVEWLSLREWELPEAEPVPSTYRQIKRGPANVHAIEREIAHAEMETGPKPPPPPDPLTALSPIVARIESALRRKGQVILFGPPGTGKTHHAEETIRELAARSFFQNGWASLSNLDQARLQDMSESGLGAIETCCFHPAYGYEDFLEGYRPTAKAGALMFVLRDGVFKRLCRRAAAEPEREFFLLIDEVNRGDVPRIFGELLTVLERSRRGQAITLPVSGEQFAIPPNVFVVGTMNTADRSIALLDAALRRRFAFIELMPRGELLGNAVVRGIPLGQWLEALNQRVVKHVGRDARNLQVGHTYLLNGGTAVKDFALFRQVLRDEIIPLLEEYCYDRPDALSEILGAAIYNAKHSKIIDAIFELGREEDLVQALLALSPQIAASSAAVIGTNDEPDDRDGDEVA